MFLYCDESKMEEQVREFLDIDSLSDDLEDGEIVDEFNDDDSDELSEHDPSTPVGNAAFQLLNNQQKQPTSASTVASTDTVLCEDESVPMEIAESPAALGEILVSSESAVLKKMAEVTKEVSAAEAPKEGSNGEVVKVESVPESNKENVLNICSKGSDDDEQNTVSADTEDDGELVRLKMIALEGFLKAQRSQGTGPSNSYNADSSSITTDSSSGISRTKSVRTRSRRNFRYRRGMSPRERSPMSPSPPPRGSVSYYSGRDRYYRTPSPPVSSGRSRNRRSRSPLLRSPQFWLDRGSQSRLRSSSPPLTLTGHKSTQGAVESPSLLRSVCQIPKTSSTSSIPPLLPELQIERRQSPRPLRPSPPTQPSPTLMDARLCRPPPLLSLPPPPPSGPIFPRPPPPLPRHPTYP
ncbi:unnamed protein product, partial [Cyprideis torosa]